MFDLEAVAAATTGHHALDQCRRVERPGLAELDREILEGHALDEGAHSEPQPVGVGGPAAR